MDFITYALANIKRHIPKEVLRIAYTPNDFRTQFTTIDDLIIDRVIEGIVLMDTQLMTGREVRIPSANCKVLQQGEGYFVLHVPPELTANKKIISALSLVSSSTQFNTGIGGSVNPLLNAGSRLQQSFDTSPINTMVELELVGNNVILVHAEYHTYMDGILKVEVMNDNKLSHISTHSYPDMAKACLLAAKLNIRNELLVSLNKGFLYNGHDLTIIKDIVDSYADAAELYEEHRELIVNKIMFMNDQVAMGNYVKILIN